MKKRIAYILLTLSIFTATYLISQNYYQLVLIQGQSMSPTYHNYEFAIIDKLTSTLKHGDVIAFHCENLHATLIKRIVAIPGDTVYIKDQKLYVNGEPSNVIPADTLYTYAGTASHPIVLAQDEYYVLGDNYAYSKDSRYSEIGIIKRADIIGPLIPQRAIVSFSE